LLCELFLCILIFGIARTSGARRSMSRRCSIRFSCSSSVAWARSLLVPDLVYIVCDGIMHNSRSHALVGNGVLGMP